MLLHVLPGSWLRLSLLLPDAHCQQQQDPAMPPGTTHPTTAALSTPPDTPAPSPPLLPGAKQRKEIYEAFENIYPILQEFRKGDAAMLPPAPAPAAQQPAGMLPPAPRSRAQPTSNLPPPTPAHTGLPPPTPMTGLPPATPAHPGLPPPTPSHHGLPPATPAYEGVVAGQFAPALPR
jgi:hypothetical protein